MMIDPPIISHGDDIVHADPDLPGAQPVAAQAPLPVLDEDQIGAAPRSLPADFPAGAVLQADGSVILRLDYPAVLKFRDHEGKINAETYRELHMKRLTGKTRKQLAAAAGTEDYQATLIAVSTGISLGRAMLLYDVMDAADIAAAVRVVLFFITPGRRTQP